MNKIIKRLAPLFLSVVLGMPLAAQADIFSNSYIQDNNLLDGYSLAYSYNNLPANVSSTSFNLSNYKTGPGSYIGMPYSNAAYYVELEVSGSNRPEWVLTTFDTNAAFRGSMESLLIPCGNATSQTPSNSAVQTIVNNVNAWISTPNLTPLFTESSKAGTDGNGNAVYSLTGKKGTVESWGTNYGGNAGLSTAEVGGTNSIDWNDSGWGYGNGHGSYQVNIVDTNSSGGISGQTLFGYMHFGNKGNLAGLGLGVTAATGDNDWTWGRSNSGNAQNYNAGEYSTRQLQVLVKTPTEAEREAYYAPITEKYSAAPELKSMALAYDLDIPTGAAYNTSQIPYTYDASSSLSFLNGSVGRIGYLVTNENDWVYVSMDAFTQDVAKAGVPSKGPNGSFYTEGNNGSFDGTVTNLFIAAAEGSNVKNTGAFAKGKIQFWGTDYSDSGSSDGFGINDTRTSANDYASMQIHNTSVTTAQSNAGETVFAYNSWGANANGPSAFGIGNCPVANRSDWTFQGTADAAKDQNIKVFIEPTFVSNAPESKNYQLVYAANLDNAKFKGYSYDNSANMTGDVQRVGYYLEIQKSNASESQWIFVSGDTFTTDIAKIGVPIKGNGFAIDGLLRNMSVTSNVDGVANGTGFVGKVQFWPNNYANGGKGYGPYDTITATGGVLTDGYGSMQIFNCSDAFKTLFAYNNWNNDENSCLGIGNPATGEADWTHIKNGSEYTIKNMYVFAQMADPNAQPYENVKIDINALFDDPKGTDIKTAMGTNTKGTKLANDSNVLGIAKVQVGSATALKTTTLTNNVDSPQFDFAKVGSNVSWASSVIKNGYCEDGTALPTGWEGFGIHAEGMMTIDLNELRTSAAIPGGIDLTFNALAIKDIAESPLQIGGVYAIALLSNDEKVLGGYVNGTYFDAIQDPNGVWSLDTIIDSNFIIDGVAPLDGNRLAAMFDFDITDEADYLTLAVTSSTDLTSDHVVWYSPTLTSKVPEPSSVTLLILGAAGLFWIRKRVAARK